MRQGPFFLGAMVVCMASAQVLLKFAGLNIAIREDVLIALLGNPFLWASLAASAVGLACWLVTLRNMPLSSAYPWTALIYVITPLASAWQFNDAVGLRYMVGMVAIVTGVFVTTSGSNRAP